MDSTIYIGIDPGVSGGMACLQGEVVHNCIAMPPTEWDAWQCFEEIKRTKLPMFATLEKVGGYMAGSGGNIGSAMFKFGTSYGMARAFLVAAGIPFEEVTPNVWQRAMGIPSRKKTMTKTAYKNVLKQAAQRLFPSTAVTLKTCDALLLAEFCRRKRLGTL